MAHWLIVARQLRRIFDYRAERISALFARESEAVASRQAEA